jgi:hypothetical protein
VARVCTTFPSAIQRLVNVAPELKPRPFAQGRLGMEKPRRPYIEFGRGAFVVIMLVVLAIPSMAHHGNSPDTTKEPSEIAAGFREFLYRVEIYASLHRSIESTLPVLEPADVPERITAHQVGLRRKIREARQEAKAGDIFTKDVEEAFRNIVRYEFQGPDGPGACATIRQGEPLR